MAEKYTQSSQLNLVVVALVALVAIVGLVALVINAATIKNMAFGNKIVSAQSTSTVPAVGSTTPNAAGDAKKPRTIRDIAVQENIVGDLKRKATGRD